MSVRMTIFPSFDGSPGKCFSKGNERPRVIVLDRPEAGAMVCLGSAP